ncbi:MAG: tRNA (adenosine(37)-N6)-dimethylallyltransferase MiaA [Pseudomonadales bacterium]|jgi:tRNA dimethylallyltransferase|nr:tRNA (adenosine(37)-N6)-dimethylallyltransferase MiaA [Pseudomonadales bacterium]
MTNPRGEERVRDAGGARWPLLLLMGPTAVGKSALAEAIAERVPADLVSVDSAAVYRGMDLGTAKPAAELRARHPYALIDIRDPADPYTAADFRRDALAAVARARAAHRVPILVGGTMLYFRVLEEGIADMPAADAAIRAELDARERDAGLPALVAELERVDPEAAGRIDRRNPRRVKRALEVYRVSGRGISSFWASQADARRDLEGFELLRIGLLPDDRSALHRVIAERFEAMLAAGLVDEVRGLRARGDLSPELPALRAVGYRQVWEYLEGERDAAELRARAVAATRQLARRQLTWLRRWPGLETLEVAPGAMPGPEAVLRLVERVEALLVAARAAAGAAP